MKKIVWTLLLFCVALLANGELGATNELDNNERFAVTSYLKTLENFDAKYVKEIERTSREGVYAVHISAGLNITHTFYVMPEVGFHSYTMIDSPKLKKTKYRAMSPLEFQQKVAKAYLVALNEEQTIKDIFTLAAPENNDTEITLYMFADDKCVTCQKAYDFFEDKPLSYKKIFINKSVKEAEFIKNIYKGDITRYKHSKYLANKLQILTPPVFLVYNNHRKEFIDIVPFFNSFAREYFQKIAEYNGKVLSYKAQEEKR